MIIKFISLILCFLVFIGNAQSKDSVSSKQIDDKISFKQFIAPVALISSGALLLNSSLNEDLQSNANNLFGDDFHTSIDNYLPFVPVAQIYLGKT